MGAMDKPGIRVELNDAGFAHVVMCKEPVNSMNADFWGALGEVLAVLEATPAVRGVIFSSGLKRDVFTAGNDINELYMPATSRTQFERFWTNQTGFLTRLYRTPLVTVAAIRGACPAGGCIVALNCDVRIITDDPSACIGLNEVALGIAVPKYWCEVMATLTGRKVAQKLLTTAAMPKALEALKLGLVDEVVPQKELIPTAEKAMKQLLRIPSTGYGITKRALREDLANDWDKYTAEEIETVYTILSSDESVKALGGVLKRLSAGANQKSKAKL